MAFFKMAYFKQVKESFNLRFVNSSFKQVDVISIITKWMLARYSGLFIVFAAAVSEAAL